MNDHTGQIIFGHPGKEHYIFSGGLNSEEIERADKLQFHETASMKEENFLGLILLGEDAMVVAKKIEGLRELEGAFRDECGLLRGDASGPTAGTRYLTALSDRLPSSAPV
jgi:hypothetical protein